MKIGSRVKNRVSLGFGNLYASVGDHIGYFYLTGEEEQGVLVSFLEAGLSGRDKCVCLVGAGRTRERLQELQRRSSTTIT